MTMEPCDATTLEFHDVQANSHKFYRTYVVGCWAVYQWGRVGAVGQWNGAKYPHPAAARTAARDKLSSKRAEGYLDTDSHTFDFDDASLSTDKATLVRLDETRRGGWATRPAQAPAPAASPVPPAAKAAKKVLVSDPHAEFAARALAAISLAVTDPQAAAVEFAMLNDQWKALEQSHAKAASYLKTLDQLLIGATR